MNFNVILRRGISLLHGKLLKTSVNVSDSPIIQNFLAQGVTSGLRKIKYCTALAKVNNQLRKQQFKKKNNELFGDKESLKIFAYSSAEEFDLSSLTVNLKNELKYKLSPANNDLVEFDSVIHLNLHRDSGEAESKDVFVFKEGSVVFWNFNETETSEFLEFLKGFHKGSFSTKIVESENETIPYIRINESGKTNIIGGKVILHTNGNEALEKFAISNAMALSVLLGAYEAVLNDYIDSMLPVTEDLKSGRTIQMSREEVLRKTGQLFSLRHVINLSSDLLDTPDFYWDREELEYLYSKTFKYFCIGKRTRVINEKINHCIELVELLSAQLSDEHHVRLEWMIIALIMVEVAFEILHYLERYMVSVE